jgi:hypothetical protein
MIGKEIKERGRSRGWDWTRGGGRGGWGFGGWSGTVWGTLESPRSPPGHPPQKKGKLAFVLTQGKLTNCRRGFYKKKNAGICCRTIV